MIKSNELIQVQAKFTEDALNFDEIYDHYYQKIYRYVSFRVYDSNDVEDLVQVIFLRVYEKLDKFNKNVGSFEPWLYTISANILRDYFRKKKLRSFVGLDKLKNLVSNDNLEANLQSKEEILLVKKEILKLKTKDQEILALRFGAELSYEEISKITGIGKSNIGVKIHRLTKDLEKKLKNT